MSYIATFVGIIIDFHNLSFIKDYVRAKLEADDQNWFWRSLRCEISKNIHILIKYTHIFILLDTIRMACIS